MSAPIPMLSCPANAPRSQRMVDFYGGAGTFAGWPQRVRDYAIETTLCQLLDWKALMDSRLTSAALAAVKIPTLVVWG